MGKEGWRYLGVGNSEPKRSRLVQTLNLQSLDRGLQAISGDTERIKVGYNIEYDDILFMDVISESRRQIN